MQYFTYLYINLSRIRFGDEQMTPSMKKNEDAVSPVIGVILMVAITVILAAVIAMFVFGMATDIGSAKVVGLTVSENDTSLATVNVLWQGGGDLNQLKNMSGSVDGVAFSEITISPTPAVGVISPINTGSAVSGKRVILVGHFNDGQQQMLFDKYL